jgi:biotin synthase-related radical SAM superfamily protein
MTFDINEKITDFGINEHRLNEIIETGEPFQTSGCTFCNRPYYNERPSGPIFNFPWKPSREDILTIRNQLKKE